MDIFQYSTMIPTLTFYICTLLYQKNMKLFFLIIFTKEKQMMSKYNWKKIKKLQNFSRA